MEVSNYDSLLMYKIHSFCTILKFDISQIECLKQLESLKSTSWKCDVFPILIKIYCSSSSSSNCNETKEYLKSEDIS